MGLGSHELFLVHINDVVNSLKKAYLEVLKLISSKFFSVDTNTLYFISVINMTLVVSLLYDL